MSDYEGLFEQALSLMSSGTAYGKAVTAWEAALQCLEPGDEGTLEERAIVTLNLAICCHHSGAQQRAIELCEPFLDGRVCAIEPGSDLGQQFLGVILDASLTKGDLGRARVTSEKCLQALEASLGDCSPQVMTATAERRGNLARTMGQPDDAEEAFALVLEHFKNLLTQAYDQELHLLRAQLFQSRAHNRWQGQALELAELDLEDAVETFLRELGPEHEKTRQAQELFRQLRG